MQDYKKRVIVEKEELDRKVQKLEKFLDSEIFSGLRNYEKTLLHIQYEAMLQYSGAIEKRIQHFQ